MQDSSSLAASVSTLLDRYRRVRDFSHRLCESLSPEDCTVQSMPDASPARWHLAHTTWFFDTFVLQPLAHYEPFNEQFVVLYNSYYNAVGEQFSRAHRGVLSRPSQDEVLGYRRHVDDAIAALIEGECLAAEQQRIVELGLQHEQQHQELLLTDIKHAFASNPLAPIYREGTWSKAPACDGDWLEIDEDVYEIGHASEEFAYDNESPRHRVYLHAAAVATRAVTCGEFLEFIDGGGYERPEHWLSMGWNAVQEYNWRAPLYWQQRDGEWHHFTLAGMRPVDLARPVCHVSYFEADAFARWAGYRLPTEQEWEVAAARVKTRGAFADTLLSGDQAIHPVAESGASFLGNTWDWTASQYTAYPGYQAPSGALGEYNGKFMCNQFVLRGGSCATHSEHIRPTYRNFFPPDARWQFSGFRLAK